MDEFAGENRERVTGIEPAWPAWKAGALPLSYTREVLRQPNWPVGDVFAAAVPGYCGPGTTMPCS
jgi:hypothetical protein